MMQPRDAHDDGDCAMEEVEAGLDSSPLPANVMTTTHHRHHSKKTDASSPSAASNQQQLTNDDALLVGARKRKAIRVVKHQQVSLHSIHPFFIHFRFFYVFDLLIKY